MARYSTRVGDGLRVGMDPATFTKRFKSLIDAFAAYLRAGGSTCRRH
jgi:hypothetical protein